MPYIVVYIRKIIEFKLKKNSYLTASIFISAFQDVLFLKFLKSCVKCVNFYYVFDNKATKTSFHLFC
mgnify:CR=1 FL=1